MKRRGPRNLVAACALLVVACAAVACATTPDVGVRKSYRKSRVDSATVVPFFSRSNYSLKQERLGERIRWAQSTAVEWLEARRISVTAPEKTRQSLQAGGVWETFRSDGLLRRNLAESFESSREEQQAATQRKRLRELWSKRLVPSRFLLFGEILYQTTGKCETRADEYTRRATVVVVDEASETVPRPCIVTHFHARLVDASTGSTVWYNRRLREMHVPAIEERWVRENVRKVVRATLGGTGGLHKLIEDPR